MGSQSEKLTLDAVIVGAGFSGIALLHRLRQQGLNVKIFEAGSDLGGTWYWNRYPGARVDSEIPFYQLNIPEVWRTWDFSERFPTRDELCRYFAHVDKVLNVKKDTVFNAKVVGAEWDPEMATWTVTTDRGHIASGRYLLLGTGALHRPYIPDFPGVIEYKGAMFHAANWPDNIDVKGKRVAVIGSAATAVQVVQEESKQAEKLTMFMRRPTYCLPMRNRPVSVEEQNGSRAYYAAIFELARRSAHGFPVTRPAKSIWDATPEERERHYEEIWRQGGFNFNVNHYRDVMLDKEANKIAYDFWARKIRARMSDPVKAEMMAPKEPPYWMGSKRAPLEGDFYECLDRSNVEIVDLKKNPLKTFSGKGIITEDGEREFDVVILATGFDAYTGSVTNMGLKNKNGKDIKNVWGENGLRMYLGLMVQGFPNAFFTYSLYSPGYSGNATTIIECQADCICTAIKNLDASKDLKTLEPTTEAQEEWYQLVQMMSAPTLLPLTDSWWNVANVPGKKREMVTWLLGIDAYEKAIREKLEGWKGFVVA